jgi:molybdopterin-guanine dinucleotide biosynthesis protein A
MLSAAILTGGRATRFGGQDKSALVVDGRTIFDRQVNVLSQIAGEILLVGGTMREMSKTRPGVTPIADLMPGCGPLGGLHAALTAAQGRVVVVVACDMPYVTAPFLAYLASLAGGPAGRSEVREHSAPAEQSEAGECSEPNEFIAVVPQTEDGYHPLCAAYTRSAIEPIERQLAAGRLKMTDLLAKVRLRVVTAHDIGRFGDPHQLLANVNTPAEHESLEALHNHEL